MRKVTVGLAMIVKNERSNLPRLFKSISGCFDQIVIVDTGSTDGTVEFLLRSSTEKLPIEVHQFNWIDDFSSARNYSISFLKTDFVAWLDADDVLVDVNKFKKFKFSSMYRKDIWFMPYQTFSDKNLSRQFTHSVERVFRRSLDAKFYGWVHEAVLIQPNWRVGRVKNVFVQHRRSRTTDQAHLKRNLRILRDQKKKAPRTFGGRLRFQLGLELFDLGKYDEAEVELRIASRSKELGKDLLIYLYQKLVYIDLIRAQHRSNIKLRQIRRRVISNCRRAILLDRHAAEFHCWAAEIELICERQSAALDAYALAIKCKSHNLRTRNIEQSELDRYYNEWPRLQRIAILIDLGELRSAIKELKRLPLRYRGAESNRLSKIALKRLASHRTPIRFERQDI